MEKEYDMAAMIRSAMSHERIAADIALDGEEGMHLSNIKIAN